MDYSNFPKTRAEAKAQGATHYFTGEPCKHGHVAPRKTKGACVECVKVAAKAALAKRAEYFAEYNKSPAGQAAKKAYYERNRELVIARAVSRPAEAIAYYRKAWKADNPEFVRSDMQNRRRRHRNATPSWLSAEHMTQMRTLYTTALETSRATGQRYEVDHIYPLRSNVVCGLHVPWNLQLLPKVHNGAKSNKLPDESMALAFPDALTPRK